MNKCKHCNSEISGRKVYCNNACQQAFQQAEKIEEWLRTGKAVVRGDPDHYVKRYIADQQKNKCDLCKTGNRWFGKPLSFILDHIDGNADNNRRENLRLICHNCDSQLDTYKSKNRGNGRFSRTQRYHDGKSY